MIVHIHLYQEESKYIFMELFEVKNWGLRAESLKSGQILGTRISTRGEEIDNQLVDFHVIIQLLRNFAIN